MKNLLAFLDDISKEKEDLKPSKNIHYDYTQFSTYLSEIEAKLTSLEELNKERNIADYQVLNEGYKIYAEVLPQLEYLKTVDELSVCKAYHATLLHDTEKFFPANLSSDNKEQYIRLKFRA